MKKVWSILLVISLIFSMLICAFAVDDFPNTYVNTGNQADDIIGVANTQMGYSCPAGHSKYGDWYLGIDGEYMEWCGAFIAWCAVHADISEDIIPRTASVAEYYNRLPKIYASAANGGTYNPQKGDIIFFDWYADDTLDHVGLVSGFDGENVYVIDGNYSNKVNINRKLSKNDSEIYAYGHPSYKGGAPTLSSISVQTTPTKTTYTVGDSFNSAGLTIKAVYSDKTSKIIKSGFKVSGFSSDCAGTKTVTVAYGGEKTTFTVTVKDKYSKGTYTVKQSKINMYSNHTNTSKVLTTVNKGTVLKITEIYGVWGKADYGKYSGWVGMPLLSLTANRKLASIRIDTKPKCGYYIGQSFDKTGMVVTAVYSDSSTQSVTNYTLSGYNSSKAGVSNITVKYGGKTTVLPVKIISPTITLAKTSLNLYDTQVYSLTATTKPANQAVEWTTSDKSIATVSNGKITALKKGNAVIKASFKAYGKTYTTSCKISVYSRTLKSISVNKLPDKTVYCDGEKLDTNGLKINLNYNLGKPSVVASGFTVSGYNCDKVGTQSLTVTYSGMKTAFNISLYADYIPVATAEYKGNIYMLFDEDVLFSGAVKKCEQLGGHLVTVTSQDEQKIINQLIAKGGRNNYWIAMSDVGKKSGSYYWITGEAKGYTNWIEGQPNANKGENGVIVQKNYSGGWNDIATNLNTQVGFICEIETDKFIPAADMNYNGNTYYRFDKHISWYGAKLICEQLGGHLAVVSSDAEQSALKTFAVKGTASSYWLGATDSQKEGSFNWVTAEAFSYKNWVSGAPDNKNRCEHFVEMKKDDGFKWNDISNVGRYDTVTGFILETEQLDLTLDRHDASVISGYTLKLDAEIKSKLYNNEKVKWSTDNSNVATVSSNGTVKGAYSGTAIIAAEVNGVKDFCRVNVIGNSKYEIMPKVNTGIIITRDNNCISGLKSGITVKELCSMLVNDSIGVIGTDGYELTDLQTISNGCKVRLYDKNFKVIDELTVNGIK